MLEDQFKATCGTNLGKNGIFVDMSNNSQTQRKWMTIITYELNRQANSHFDIDIRVSQTILFEFMHPRTTLGYQN